MIQEVRKALAGRKISKLKNKKVLLFDLGVTICDIPIEPRWKEINHAGIMSVFLKLGLDEKLSKKRLGELAYGFVASKERLRKLAKENYAEYEIKQQIKVFLDEAGIKIRLSRKLLYELEMLYVWPELEISELFDGAAHVLKKLKKTHQMYILSNNVSSVLVREILKKHRIGGYFNGVFVSADLGMRKPDVRFLENTLKTISASPEDCIIIGDRLNQDIIMANRMNISSVFVSIKEHVDNTSAGKITYDTKISSLHDLARIL
ncbi:MAG: HAD family hydrolase [Nanoarchaeota archaeon]|nr:HAD family hydrolase [Nanoarchaeota archaeon]